MNKEKDREHLIGPAYHCLIPILASVWIVVEVLYASNGSRLLLLSKSFSGLCAL